MYVDTRLAVQPQPKPRRCHLMSVDKSIMEMQRIYPDLAFRGRPLVPDKPHQENSSSSRSSSSKGVQTAGDDSKGAEPHKRDSVKGTRAAASTVGCKADEAFGDNSTSCNDDFTTPGTAPQGNTVSSSTDRSRVDELSGPQAISLHITLRTGSNAEKSQKPGEPQPIAEPLCWTQQQAAAGNTHTGNGFLASFSHFVLENECFVACCTKNKFNINVIFTDALNRSLVKAEPPSLSSVDEEQELRELAQRMGQLQVHETREEVKRKEEHKKGGENANKEKSKKWRKPRTEGEPEEQNLRKPVMETGAALSRDANRRSTSSQYDHAVVKEQKQPNMYHPSLVAVTAADCEGCKRGGGTGQQEGEDPGRADAARGEEQLAHSFIII